MTLISFLGLAFALFAIFIVALLIVLALLYYTTPGV